MTLTNLFEEAVDRKASDIHLSTGQVPALRISGGLVRLDEPALTPDSMASLLDELLTPEARARLEIGQPVERTLIRGDLSFAGIAFRYDSQGIAATFRIIGHGVPDLEKIAEGAESFFAEMLNATRGLLLFTGPTGSGKFTTASSLVDRINATRASRIFVVESHPAYRFESKMGMVTQMHVGQAIDGYVTAMNAAHQADLDVILLDDLPTTEELRQAILLADTGHLVVANLHAESAVEAIQRLFDSAESSLPALRRALAQNLLAVVGQRLFPRIDRPGRVPAYEWIAMTPETRAAIASGDLEQLRLLQAENAKCRTFEASLAALSTEGKISEEAISSYR